MIDPAKFADHYQPEFGFPYTPPKSVEELNKLSDEALGSYAKARQMVEAGQLTNPIAVGWTLPMWTKVMENWKKYKNHIICGGNRSSKSTFTGRLAPWAACTIPGAEVHLYQVNKEKSVNEQQRYVWDAIPQSIKSIPTKKGQNHSIQYSQKNGFTDNVCIFPPHSGARRGGYMQFHNYAQFADDPNTAESFKAHLIVLDEECPLDLFKTLQYRTVDYRGRIVLGFTTIQGWTPLVQHVLAKTKTLEKRFAPLIGRELPTIQESLSCPDTIIYYFWTEDNAFVDVEDFRKTMKGKPRDEILARAYGVPTKSVTGVFPAFSREYAPVGNVVKHEDLPFIKKKDYKVTRYMAIDPAGSKNWFIAWVAIDAAGTWWVYREWPDYDDWAMPGDKEGPAQRGSKRGIKDYVDLIKAAEGDEKIYERYIDPRLGAAEKQSADGATTIISELDDQDMTVIPAPGVEIENGLQLLQNLLAYDDSKPISALNAPKFYVSDRCANLIYSLENYAKVSLKENTKDPIDCLRYIAVSNPEFYEETKDTADHPTGVY
jgi:hypothetical protein